MIEVEEAAKAGGDAFYQLWNRFRTVIYFILGIVLIVYAMFNPEVDLAFVVVGGVLIGLVPADQWVQARIQAPKKKDGEKPAA